METNRLRQFRVIVETGNLRKAADILGISHSGLSKSMKALEVELGVSLFHPSGRGIVISDEGKNIFERSEKFLDELDHFMGDAEAQAPRRLRIGSFDVFTSYFIGPLLKDYLPDMAVEVHELVPGRLEEALAFNRVDVGITYEPIPRKGVEYVRVTSLLMGVFAKPGRFSNDDLSAVPFVTPAHPLEGIPSGVKGLDAWPDDKVERNIRYRVDSLASGLELTRQGLAAIFMPKFVARLHDQTVVADRRFEALKLPRGLANVRRNVFIVKRESTAEDQIIRQMARALRDICSE
jgi:DNA-binding transcriptional LysR family regulator